MIYCMSDIHGNLLSYQTMLRMIRFTENDTLYILGDIVDRGYGGMEILLDMMRRPNIVPILGNHDDMAYRALNELYHEPERFPQNPQETDTWLCLGGIPTLQEFQRLKNDDKEAILRYLASFSLYKEVTVGDRRFVLVHTGPGDFSPDKPLSAYSRDDLLWACTDYEEVYYPDKHLVTGHTPTRRIRLMIDGCSNDMIFIRDHHIAIDCGSGIGGLLGAICLDTFETFYA